MITLDRVVGVFLTQEEVADVIRLWLSSQTLHCVLLKWPFALQAYKTSDRIAIGDFDEAWIDVRPFETQAKSMTELVIQNRESFQFRFPKQTSAAIVEGSIGSLATEAPRKQLWLSLLQEIVATTSSGMWAYNTSSKKLILAPNHRCSTQAANLQSQGVVLKASSGNSLFFPDHPAFDTYKSKEKNAI